MKSIDSIIFDLDGTIWDSIDVVTEVWNITLQEKGIDHKVTKDDIRSVTGKPFGELSKKLLPHLSEEEQKEITDRSGELEFKYLKEHGGKLYDHVEELLKKLSEKYKLALVSNCQKEYMEAFFSYHKLEKYFVDYENPGRTGLAKSENIKLVIKRSHLKNSVYVGDTDGDQQAAKEAGIPFVYANYGFGEVDDYDYSIDCFKDLLKLFE